MTINLRTEGDINFSEERLEWNDSITHRQTRELLDEDAKYFFHQYMSTPCLDVLAECDGSTLTTISGRKFLDFHGNSVHQAGFRNPQIIAKVKQQKVKSYCKTYCKPI